jgi:NAD(P)-dependent dehydrogenase (short-subunit alcohol dehydrogenase family)
MSYNSAVSLEDEVVLVTGASRGIGASIARACAAAGAKVALASRKLEGLESVKAEIEAAGGTAIAVAAHMGRADDIERLFTTVRETFGPCDGLVNNAATNPYFGPMVAIEEAAFDKTFEVNVKGYFNTARAFVAQRQAAGLKGGSIVNIASVAGMRAAPFQGVYGMTKAAVISMTQTLGYELGSARIRCNAICPGLIETKFASAIVNNDALRDQVIGRTALQRHGQPEEIAGAATYLLSDASSYMTCQTVVIDGGLISA